MREWFRLAFSEAVVKRALVYAVVVGTLLVAINHGDAILRGNVDTARLFKMGLTVFVPYTVSTLSSVSAVRSLQTESSSDALLPRSDDGANGRSGSADD